MIFADATTDTLGFAGRLGTDVGINSAWVMLAAVLVMFMQAGFAMLEIGFVRGKNAGSVVAKVLVNFALAALGFWAIGFALAFGGTDALIGTNGFFVAHANDFPLTFPTNQHGVTVEVLWFFQFVFCAVALAIVWGTTLERIKFGVYIIYALVFSAFIYPVVAHWIFGGGWLAGDIHVQDFAGSIVVDVCAAAAALAILLARAAARQVRQRREPPRDPWPQHAALRARRVDPVAGMVFNPGSTLTALDGRFGTIAMVTQLAGRLGIIAAMIVMHAKTKTFDIGMAGNGAIAGLVAVTGPAGYIDPWAAPDHRRSRRRHRRLRRAVDRPARRRSGRCAGRSRPGRDVGRDRVRAVCRATAGRARPPGEQRRPVLHGLVQSSSAPSSSGSWWWRRSRSWCPTRSSG